MAVRSLDKSTAQIFRWGGGAGRRFRSRARGVMSNGNSYLRRSSRSSSGFSISSFGSSSVSVGSRGIIGRCSRTHRRSVGAIQAHRLRPRHWGNLRSSITLIPISRAGSLRLARGRGAPACHFQAHRPAGSRQCALILRVLQPLGEFAPDVLHRARLSKGWVRQEDRAVAARTWESAHLDTLQGLERR